MLTSFSVEVLPITALSLQRRDRTGMVVQQHLGDPQTWKGCAVDGAYRTDNGLVLLAPEWEAFYKGADMVKGDFTGDLDKFTAAPAEGKRVHLWHLNSTPDDTATVTSRYLLPARPLLVWNIERYPYPQGQTVQAVYALSFGREWSLVVQGFPSYGPAILYRNGVEFARQDIPDSARQQYVEATSLRLEIFNLGDDLYITSPALGGLWTVTGTGALVSAPFTVASTGGVWGFNLSPLTFPASGTIETPVLPRWWDYQGKPFYCATYPRKWAQITDPQDPGLVDPFGGPGEGTVSVEQFDETATSSRYRLRLSAPASDPSHSPFLSYWQGWYYPEYTTPDTAPTALDVTEYVTSASLRRTQDPFGDTLTLELNNNGDTLLTALQSADLDAGQVVLRFAVAVDYEDGGDPVILYWWGIVDVRGYKNEHALGASSLVAIDLSHTGAGEIRFSPCVAGFSATYGFLLRAGFAGISPTYTQIIDPCHTVLQSPEHGWDSPPWQAQFSAKGLDTLREVLAYTGGDMVARFAFPDNAPSFQIRKKSTESVASYDAEDASPRHSIISLNRLDDTSGVGNDFWAMGTVDSGDTVYAHLESDPLFFQTGYRVSVSKSDGNAVTPEQLSTVALREMQAAKPAPYRDELILLNGHTLTPGDVLSVSSPKADYGTRRVEVVESTVTVTRGWVSTAVSAQELR